MDWAVLEFTFLLIVILWAYKFLIKNHDFFERRDVKYVKPTILFGNFLGLLVGREDAISVFQKPYDMFRSEKIFGMFQFLSPRFIVKDADIVKQITIKDFNHFVNHDGSLTEGSDGIFGKSVFLLEDNQWREMRNYLTPIFTSSKLKTMFHHLTATCAQDLTEYLDERLQTTGELVIEAKDIFSRFTAESISTTALGFKGNCIKDSSSDVYKLAKDIQEDFSSGLGALKMAFIPIFPTLAKFLGLKVFRQSTHDFFKKFVIDEVARRETQGITIVNDVIHHLIQAKNGQLKDESGKENKITRKYLNWDDAELIAAQIFIFFAGGFETTSSLMQMCSWELAMNRKIQKKLIQEVDEVLATLNGQPVSYEALNKMKLLDMIVNETLRKWPPLPMGIRECTSDYVLHTSDGQAIQIMKGDKLTIPFRMMQRDPKYFKNPSRFDPTRFSPENKHKIVPGSFISFGHGPRLCLGSILALLETKLVFFTILSRYSIEVCSKTPKQFTYSVSPVAFKEDLYVELKPRQQKNVNR